MTVSRTGIPEVVDPDSSDMPTIESDRRPTYLASTACAVAVVLALPVAAAPDLEDDGAAPEAPQQPALLDAICAIDAASNVCACRDQPEQSTRVERVHDGSFTERGSDQRLVAVRGCGRTGTALLRREADHWSGEAYYPDVHTDTCLAYDRDEAPQLLVCHRTVETETWRVGWIHQLDFRDGTVERRQLTSYESNARGCPTNRLRTTHPLRWSRWQVDGDPRAPLLTLHLQHRNGTVPSEYGDACEAMKDGDPVFGARRVRTEYFELDGDRFRFAGATRTTSDSAPSRAPRPDDNDAESKAEWISSRRVEEPVCRRSDVRTEIRSHRSELSDCYRRALRDDRTLGGVLKLRWSIDRSGAVDSVQVVADELSDATLRSCVESVVQSFEFPPPRAGEACSFVYPFRFETQSEETTSEATSTGNRP